MFIQTTSNPWGTRPPSTHSPIVGSIFLRNKGLIPPHSTAVGMAGATVETYMGNQSNAHILRRDRFISFYGSTMLYVLYF